MRPDTLKTAKSVVELKIGNSERRDRHSLGGVDFKEGKSRLRHIIKRALKQDMENRKANDLPLFLQ